MEQNYSPESVKSPYSILQAFTSQNEKETFEFGKIIAAQLKPGDVIGLFGDLGSGKTTCIKGICSGLGVTEEVTSPTFTLINEYQGRLPVFHFDFYRISAKSALKDLGLEEYLSGEGICLIEWPEIIVDLLPDQRFEIHLALQYEAGWKNRRQVILKKRGT
jgi:tRNA threonylcarbamoyladenosine biosynthesis protein TsaE